MKKGKNHNTRRPLNTSTISTLIIMDYTKFFSNIQTNRLTTTSIKTIIPIIIMYQISSPKLDNTRDKRRDLTRWNTQMGLEDHTKINTTRIEEYRARNPHIKFEPKQTTVDLPSSKNIKVLTFILSFSKLHFFFSNFWAAARDPLTASVLCF